jgi:nucleoside-diphosphate-sugar epimerase
LKTASYRCFLGPETALPMMYMNDAVRATLELMEAPAECVKERHAYNLAGVSFTPEEIAEAIKAEIPDFEIDYAPDFRQAIADSWPASIDDRAASADWGWKAQFDLRGMVREMLSQLRKQG